MKEIKDKDCQICPKCKKPMKDITYLMMGKGHHCFKCAIRKMKNAGIPHVYNS